MSKAETNKVAGVSSAAVKAKTGRGWDNWFKLLDRAGASQWNHTQIAADLYEEFQCPGWWNQMVAVGYEQARGLRPPRNFFCLQPRAATAPATPAAGRGSKKVPDPFPPVFRPPEIAGVVILEPTGVRQASA